MREHGSRKLVVGFDGTDPAGRAVDWAADEATRRQVPLEVVFVVDRGTLGGSPATASPWEPSPLAKAAQAVTTVGVDRAADRHRHLELRGRTIVGSPRTELPVAAQDAALLVVGSRGHGDVASSVLGSVAAAVAVHAPCPVVVVRGDRVVAPGPHHPVIVGVDDSEPANEALRFAADLAAAAHAPLRIVTAHRPLALDSWARACWQAVDPGTDPVAAADEAARVVLAHAREVVRARQPGVVMQGVAAEGGPAGVILAHAKDAALVVVGARGRGSLASLFLGSVSHGVVHDAACPVAIVHAGAQVPTETDRAATV
jgi:nucleotide-binding universal stress UspA family protein